MCQQTRRGALVDASPYLFLTSAYVLAVASALMRAFGTWYCLPTAFHASFHSELSVIVL